MKTKAQFIYIMLFAIGQFLIQVDVAFAVVANPEPISYTQPDGSTLTVFLKGDEFIHWAVTSDGYTIMTNSEGVYEYAKVDNSGRLVFSGIQANDPVNRSQAEDSWLKKTEKGIFFSEAQIKDMKDQLVNGGASDAPLMGGFPSTGTRKLLMIMANFSNTATTYTPANFNNYMNQVNYNGTGSFRDYYIEVSYGQLIVNTTVTVWVTLPNTHDYYGPQARWGQFAYDAIVAANTQTAVNFAEYDNNQDGTVDGVAIIHQGQGQEETGNTNDIWSHSWDLTSAGYSFSQRTFDGVQVEAYTTMPEKNASGMGTIGVMCHEFGHNLGSPDFYDTDYAAGGYYLGTGKWDLMAGGSWNGVSGSKPAHPNAWVKLSLGWTTPVELSTIQNITLRNAQVYPDVVRFNTATADEYYLCENRQQTGFDAGIPGHGLIIYHVDGNYISAHKNSNNINASSHQGLYPVCANAAGNPATIYGTINGSGCTFPGTGNKTSFTDVTTPYARSWTGALSNYPITNIYEYSPTQEVTFCFINCYTPDDPGSFSATPVSFSQINLSWNLNTNNSPVLVVYNTTPVFGTPVNGTNYVAGGVIPGGGTVLYNGSDISYSHINLNSSTNYYYKAWSILTGTTYSQGINSSATTFCNSISSFPWFEGFENAGVIPGCWTQEQVNNSGINWAFTAGNGVSNPAAAHGGTYNACLKDKTTADSKTRLISPTINLTTAVNPQLSFWHTQPMWGADQDRLTVYYKTYAGGSWTVLATYTNNIAAWTQETISLPNSSATYYIAFEGNAKFGHGVCLDDVQVANGCATFVPVSISIAASINPVCAGTSVTYTAMPLNGGTSPAYQWRMNGTDISGATNSTYTFVPNGGNMITCILTSNATCITGNPATSNTITMTLKPQLVVGSIGANQDICENTIPVQLNANAPSNGTNPTYQWQSSLNNNTFSNINGATALSFQPSALTSTTYFRQMQHDSLTCGDPVATNSVYVSVNKWLPVSVTISPSANPILADTIVTFAATPTNCGTSPFYQWKVNGENVAAGITATYSYPPTDADVVSCMMISNANCVLNNPAISDSVVMTVTTVSTTNIIQNQIVTETQCFDALQTITVAGNGSSFVVENGAYATMIAGQTINYLPGTEVKPGGYMHGFITTTGDFCGIKAPSIPKVAEEEKEEETNTVSLADTFIKVYPNPTDGAFNLELNGVDPYETVRVEIFSMTGEIVLSTKLTGTGKHGLSISGKPAGIYLIRVTAGKTSETIRIIKR